MPIKLKKFHAQQVPDSPVSATAAAPAPAAAPASQPETGMASTPAAQKKLPLSVSSCISQVPLAERYSVDELAASFKVCTKTIRRMIKQNAVPIERIGRQVRVRAEHISLLIKKEW